MKAHLILYNWRKAFDAKIAMPVGSFYFFFCLFVCLLLLLLIMLYGWCRQQEIEIRWKINVLVKLSAIYLN